MLFVLIIIAALLLLFLIPAAMLLNSMLVRSPIDLSRPETLAGTRWEAYAQVLARDIPVLKSLPWEDVYCTSHDGLRLHASLMHGSTERAVILVHGYRSSGFNDFCGMADHYIERGFSVLLTDLRAHGKSEGRLSTFGVKESLDVLSWAHFAEEHFKGDIWLHGVSMGGSSVLSAGSRGLPSRVRGIIADSPFNDPVQILSYQFEHKMHGFPTAPFIPFGKAAAVMLAGRGFLTNSSSLAAAAGIPVLIVCGDADRTVPMRMSDPIMEALGDKGKRLVIHGARHALCWLKDAKSYSSALDCLINNA